jgi:hypothetical protein
MRSQVMFVMHPSDEEEFIKVVYSEPGTVFVDGTDWPPPIVSNFQEVGSILKIWNPADTSPLTSEKLSNDKKEWWVGSNDFLAIQFCRSGFQHGHPFLLGGEICIATTSKGGEVRNALSAPSIEKRYKSLRKYIQKTYTNKVLIWQCISYPRSKNNPSEPTNLFWVGPHALAWLNEDPKNRWVQQAPTNLARGYLLDLVE